MFAARAPPCVTLMQVLLRAHCAHVPHQPCPAIARQQRGSLPLRPRARHGFTALCTDATGRPLPRTAAAATEASAASTSAAANNHAAAPLLHFVRDRPRVLVCVSRDSGPQSGGALAERLREAVGASLVREQASSQQPRRFDAHTTLTTCHHAQVWELPGDARGGPDAAAAALAAAAAAAAAAGEPPLRVAIAGGDGTASWVLGALHSAWPTELPPPACAVLPQGTGNDLARVCGWFEHPGALEALSPFGTPAALQALLRAVEAAPAAPLDWWRLEVTGAAADAGDVARSSASTKSVLFTNYFSVGFDAGVALSFDAARRAAPSLFASRAGNKAAYGLLGALDFARGACSELTQQLTLTADGVPVPLPPDAKGLLLLNIGCFMGGVRPWPDAASLPPSMAAGAAAAAHDGALEVCAHYGALHLGAMNLGLTAAVPLAVAREVRIATAAALPAQADGEAWAQAPAELLIQQHGSVSVLLAPA
jgi:hypothetical protein